jgi:chemotaxis signal transduction protein
MLEGDRHFLESGHGTRSTLRMGPLEEQETKKKPAAPQHGESVLLLPLRIGTHRLAIEASRVVEVVPGAAWTGTEDAERPVIRCDLSRALGVVSRGGGETFLARADGLIGRGPGRYVAFSVDTSERLFKAPLESFAPLPPIARDQVAVDFLVGVVRIGQRDDEMAFLLDPARLAAWEERGEATPRKGGP